MPAEVLFLNWLHTIWKGSIRLTTPMLFALGMVFVFGLGGLTGSYLGTISTDLYLHDTMFVVGHFHLTMAAASFLGELRGHLLLVPQDVRPPDERGLGKTHFWFSVVFITLVFGGQLIAGYAGQQRRLYDPYQYSILQHLRALNSGPATPRSPSASGSCVLRRQLLRELFAGSKAEANPWEVGTLEWTVASPPPHHNFDVIPTWSARAARVRQPRGEEALGRDWIGQAEELPTSAMFQRRASARVSQADEHRGVLLVPAAPRPRRGDSLYGHAHLPRSRGR